MLTREQAKELLYQHITTPNLRKHHLAAEAAMKGFAKRFGENEETWGLSGLLHDMDWEETADTPQEHTKRTIEILEPYNLPVEILNTIEAHHPDASGRNPETLMEKTIFYTEELTGLVTATALVRPDKKLASVTVESIQKKLKNKNFAKGVSRETVQQSEEALGLPLEKIIQIVLTSMQEIAEDLEL